MPKYQVKSRQLNVFCPVDICIKDGNRCRYFQVSNKIFDEVKI